MQSHIYILSAPPPPPQHTSVPILIHLQLQIFDLNVIFDLSTTFQLTLSHYTG